VGETDDLEWDDVKERENVAERGLPFAFASLIFDGRPRIEAVSRKSLPEETRFEVMAEVDGRVLFCVYVWRGEKRRVISLRVAKRKERRAYQEAIARS
jgi:uncharacterized DUF497 family protein